MGNSNVHNHKRCPLFIAGHAGGAIKGNLHLKAADGTPMANAMLTVLQTLGVDDPQLRRQQGRDRPQRRRRPRPWKGAERHDAHAPASRLAGLAAAVAVSSALLHGAEPAAAGRRRRDGQGRRHGAAAAQGRRRRQRRAGRRHDGAALGGDERRRRAGRDAAGGRRQRRGPRPGSAATRRSTWRARAAMPRSIEPLRQGRRAGERRDGHRRHAADAGRRLRQRRRVRAAGRRRRRCRPAEKRARPDGADVRRGARPHRGGQGAGRRRAPTSGWRRRSSTSPASTAPEDALQEEIRKAQNTAAPRRRQARRHRRRPHRPRAPPQVAGRHPALQLQRADRQAGRADRAALRRPPGRAPNGEGAGRRPAPT